MKKNPKDLLFSRPPVLPVKNSEMDGAKDGLRAPGSCRSSVIAFQRRARASASLRSARLTIPRARPSLKPRTFPRGTPFSRPFHCSEWRAAAMARLPGKICAWLVSCLESSNRREQRRD